MLLVLPFVIAAVLATGPVLWSRRRERPLVAYERALAAGETPSAALRGQALRAALHVPLRTALGSASVWLGVGLVLAFLSSDPLQTIVATSLISGGSVALLTYFAVERMWRPWLARLFPTLTTADMQGTFRLGVGPRLLVVLWFGTLLPLLLLALLAYRKAEQMVAAAEPQSVLTGLLALSVFIVLLGLTLTAGLAAVVFRTIVQPLSRVQAAMGQVQAGDLAVRVPVEAHDELGSMAEQFNAMTTGLQSARQEIEALHRAQVQQELVRQELAHAQDIQQGLLRDVDEAPPGVAVATVCQSATAVGGDFYDVLDLGNHQVAVVVADASGHGMAAALLAASTRATLRYALGRQQAPEVALSAVNRWLCRAATQGMFVAIACAVVDTRTGATQVANGGQVTPLLKRRPGLVEHVETPGPRLPLGVAPDLRYQAQAVDLAAGEQLVLYTDGVVETTGGAQDAAELFGFERLETLVAHLPDGPADALLTEILSAVSAHQAGAQQDDITVVVLRRAR